MIPRVRLQRVPAWLPDLTVALVVFALELLNLLIRASAPHGGVLDAGLLAGSAAPLVWRRRYPVTVGLVVAADVILLAALGVPHLGLSVLVAIYGVAALVAPPTRDWFAALAVVATVAVPLLTPDDPADIPRNLALYAAAWVLGTMQRQRAGYTDELQRRAQENARLAADVERGRIARELHDVIAHALSVMVVQTGAARAIARSDPERADRVLEQVEAVGRGSLTELRHVLGRLRASDDAAPLAPTPGLASLDELLRDFREAGLPVELTVAGARRPLAASVELAAYRIIQESLTNALKHADHPTRVVVALAFTPAELVLEVSDDAARRPDGAANGGHGLRGIRERAALLGGVAAGGPAPGGGFRVAATLPDDQRP